MSAETITQRAESQMPLKIAMALENNPYPRDVRVRNEAEELVAAGHYVVVLAPRGPSQTRSEILNGVRVKRYRLVAATRAGGIAIEYLIAVTQLSFRLVMEILRGADVVHLHNPPDLLFPVAGIARALGRAVIFDHHDLAPELYEQKFGKGHIASILRWCERMTMRVAHIVVAANESHRSVAVRRGRVAQKNVVVVRNAPRLKTLASRPYTRAGILVRPKLCYVGSLGSQDGVVLLPEILSRLSDEGRQPMLRLVGDGPELARIRGLAEELNVLELIDFLGHVAHEQVPRIIEEADICLDVAPLTPLNHMSTMIKIGEYLAAGRPIVTFGLNETRYTAGECALHAGDLDEFCGMVARLCDDEGMRATLSAKALVRARELTWEHSADRLLYAYALAAERRSQQQ